MYFPKIIFLIEFNIILVTIDILHIKVDPLKLESQIHTGKKTLGSPGVPQSKL